jgi:hypothetical protein
MSVADETGVSNAIVEPDLFERFRLVITVPNAPARESIRSSESALPSRSLGRRLVIEGEVQNSDNVVLIKAREIRPLTHEKLVGSESHDFH